MWWMIWIIFGLLIKSSLGLQNCDFNMTSWSCDDFHHYFSVRNVEETLKCIEYRKYKRPELLTIDFGRQIRQLMKVDENERNVLFEEKIWFEFNDARLKFNFCQADLNKVEFLNEFSNLFWKPDLDTPPETLFKPSLDRVLVKKNGRIKISNLHLRSTVRCSMDYTWYPFDTQICSHPILIDEPSITINYDANEVLKLSTVEHFEDPDWNITLRTGHCEEKEKHCFSLDLIFERKISTHILHEYVPSLMLSIASTASLFIPAECMPARMSLSVTTCLSMITLFVSAKNSWPKTANLKAIDYWVVLCYFAAFYSMLEYCLILALIRKDELSKRNELANWIERMSRLWIPSYLLLSSLLYFFICKTP